MRWPCQFCINVTRDSPGILHRFKGRNFAFWIIVCIYVRKICRGWWYSFEQKLLFSPVCPENPQPEFMKMDHFADGVVWRLGNPKIQPGVHDMVVWYNAHSCVHILLLFHVFPLYRYVQMASWGAPNPIFTGPELRSWSAGCCRRPGRSIVAAEHLGDRDVGELVEKCYKSIVVYLCLPPKSQGLDWLGIICPKLHIHKTFNFWANPNRQRSRAGKNPAQLCRHCKT